MYLFLAGHLQARGCALQCGLGFKITGFAGKSQRFFRALFRRLRTRNINFFGPLGYPGKDRDLGRQNLCQPPAHGKTFGVIADPVADLAR